RARVLAEVDGDLAAGRGAAGFAKAPVGFRPGVGHRAAVVGRGGVVVAGAGVVRAARLGQLVPRVGVAPRPGVGGDAADVVAGAVVVRANSHVVAGGPAGAEQQIAPGIQAVVGAHHGQLGPDRRDRRVGGHGHEVTALRVVLLAIGVVWCVGDVRGQLRLRDV